MTADQPLFHKLYGPALASLPAPIRRLHNVMEPLTLHGAARIAIGKSWLARFVATLLRFPPPGADVPLHLLMSPAEQGERWERSFGDHKMTSRLMPAATRAHVEEHLWPFVATSMVVPDRDGVDQYLTGLNCLAVPLHRTLWPRISIREGSDGDNYTFSMDIRFPWGAPLIRYEGWLDTANLEPATFASSSSKAGNDVRT